MGMVGADGCLSPVERHDERTNRWSLVTPMNIKRGFLGVCVLNEHMYAVGGNDGSGALSSVERYDEERDIWEAVAPMNSECGGVGVY